SPGLVDAQLLPAFVGWRTNLGHVDTRSTSGLGVYSVVCTILRVCRRPVAGVAGDRVVVLSIDSPHLGRFLRSRTDRDYVPHRPLPGDSSPTDDAGREGLEYRLGNLDGCSHRRYGVVGDLSLRAARFLEADR